MVWTEGHIWQSSKPIIVKDSYFEYKYVLIEDDCPENSKQEVHQWEQGVNRISDLDTLDEISDFTKEKQDTKENIDKSNVKIIQDK
jgi:hypothetical protein